VCDECGQDQGEEPKFWTGDSIDGLQEVCAGCYFKITGKESPTITTKQTDNTSDDDATVESQPTRAIASLSDLPRNRPHDDDNAIVVIPGVRPAPDNVEIAGAEGGVAPPSGVGTSQIVWQVEVR